MVGLYGPIADQEWWQRKCHEGRRKEEENQEFQKTGTPGWLSRLSVHLLIFGSGHDIMVHEIKPCIQLFAGSVGFSHHPLSLPLPSSLSLSLKINK